MLVNPSYFDDMKKARDQSTKLSNKAYELRQKAIRLQFEATAAIETVDLISEIIKDCEDPELLKPIVKTSLEATMKAAEATILAINAVEEANEADKEVNSALLVAKEAAEKLAAAIKNASQDLEITN